MNNQSAVMALSALANEKRLEVFRLLVRQGPRGLNAGDIAKAVGISATSLSFHLKELDHASLIESTREGRFIKYAIRVDGMRALLNFLTQDCCAGRPELCGVSVDALQDEVCAVERA